MSFPPRVKLFAALALVSYLAMLAVPVLAGYPVSVKDARGKTVVIKSAPKRIVSLAPSNTEILFALGLESRVVGVSSWCNYPAAAKKKQKIGDRVVSVEKVISLKPDLIVAHGKLNDTYVTRLESLGKTVIAIDPKTYDQVISDISLIGRATGTSAKASAIVRRMRSVRDSVKKKSSNAQPRALIVIQPSPLWAAGPKTLVDEMIGYAHGRNVARDAKPGFNQYPVERAIAGKPDVIIAGKGEKEFFLTSPIWRSTKAVRQKRVYEMDFDYLVRPGPRLADGLLKLDAILRR